ncbi:hypothetical protein AtubIFM55763_009926 [Aspergillus tubingensis]|uniref:18S rRNA (guanine(1575)-N(7))-methyltransferase n=1 Tax=Aspergillus tubingensis TaxID=5068 RepID=UPI0015795A07|nr:18S rRNA (guanine(1575)-N(7))-methyltransferase [Aspergillus tubingensis]GFN10215.1 18S rRNA (guanine(1575)-N(7))-methyltransferase [Aspergillus tubingensis]GLA63490.1 hypothetical protein AtubIFM54640_004638 [Aspergillus tubingensis]GLA77736.1 hypothetical protein AtubIFM55763_009926 [Aspergillus tubingensis]
MSSSILHSCPCCGQVTDISNALAAFIENPYCSQCGLSASESDSKLQNDLSALFDKGMNLETPLSPEESVGVQRPAPSSPIVYSITQHYHHSAHVAQQSTTRSSEGVHRRGTNATVNETLRQHNVDPSTLSAKQMELFEHAMPEQQSRLIQMWQISPEHSYAATSNVTGTKSLDQESSNVAGTVGHAPTPLNWAATGGDREMCDVPDRNENGDEGHQYAEPYMINGYEATAREWHGLPSSQPTHLMAEPTTGSPYKLSSDPVYYAHCRRWWEPTQQSSVEYQYGLFDEMNRHPQCGLVQPR